MVDWGDIWHGAGKVADWTPVVSNIKGAVQGNVGQAIAGPAYNVPAVGHTIDSLIGKTSQDAASAASQQQRNNAAQAAALAEQQRAYAQQAAAQANSYYNNATQAYQSLYGQGTPAYNTYAPAQYSGSSNGRLGGGSLLGGMDSFGQPLTGAKGPGTTTYHPGTPAGSLTLPGYGELAYQQHGNDFLGLNASSNYFNAVSPQLMAPSAAESFFNPAAYQRTTNAENFYNQNASRYQSNTMNDAYQGLFNGLSTSPIAQSYQGLMGRLAGPADTTSLYHDTYNLYNNDAMTSALPGLTSRLAGPSETQSLYGGEAYKYDQNIMSTDWRNNLSQQLDPARGWLYNNNEQINNALLSQDMQEQLGNSIRQGLTNSNNLSGNLNDMLAHAQGNIQDRNYQGQGLIRQEQGPSSTQQEYGNIRGAYGSPGLFEQFAQQALTGNDPYMAMLQRDQTANLDASINARGGYNSGAAFRELGIQNSDLEAKKYAQLAGITQNAQNMQLQRAAGLQGLAGQTEGEIQQRLKAQDTIGQELYGNQIGLTAQEAAMRLSAGQEQRDIQNAISAQAASQDASRLARTMGQVNLGQATDASTLQYLQERANAANMASTQDLNYLQGKANLAMGADATTLARIAESGNLANMAASQRLNYLGQRANLANMSDVNTLGRVTESGNLANMASVDQYNRIMGQGSLANMTASQNLNYLNSQGNAANAADTSYLNLLNSGQNAANAVSSAQLARIMGGGQLAQNSDVQGRQNLQSYFSMAQSAQQAQEQRQMQSFNAAMQLAAAQAGNYMQGQQIGMNEYDNWLAQSMGLQGNAAAIAMNAANAQQQQLWKLGGTIAGGIFGGPGGAALGGQLGGQVFTNPVSQPQLTMPAPLPPVYQNLGYNPYPAGTLVPPLKQPTW